jgi:predicted RNA-binding Zn ribbon-like protein
MVFDHDAEEALLAAASLVNAELVDISVLEALLAGHRRAGDISRDESELDAIRALRAWLRALWTLPLKDLVDEVNRMLHTAGAVPQLVAHDGWDYHVHGTPVEAPLTDRIAVETAMALIEVVRQGQLSRLQECAADDCAHVLVDLSKNRSRRYCSVTCANRVNAAAFRSRQRG